MTDEKTTFAEVKKRASQFAHERDWRQFHSPKNLSMAIAAEAAELMEYFMWLEGSESDDAMRGPKREEIEHEMADIAFALLMLCAHYDIDLSDAIERKIKITSERYPASTVKGRREKYTEYLKQKEAK